MTLSERDFQRQVLDVAKMFGWAVYHPYLSKWSEKGWPDLALCRPPRLILAELKSEKGRVTPEQQRWLDMLAACPGVEARVWKPSDFDSIVEALT